MSTLDIAIIIAVSTVAIAWLLRRVVILLDALIHPRIPIWIKLILTTKDIQEETGNFKNSAVLIKLNKMVAIPTIGSILIEEGIRAKIYEVSVANNYCEAICHMTLDDYDFEEDVKDYIETYGWSRHTDDEIVNNVYRTIKSMKSN